MRKAPRKTRTDRPMAVASPIEGAFNEIVALIRSARERAARAVNVELIGLYWRMRQFFVAYHDEPKLSSLLRELPWSSHLHILSCSKRPEEREFYLRTKLVSPRDLAREETDGKHAVV